MALFCKIRNYALNVNTWLEWTKNMTGSYMKTTAYPRFLYDEGRLGVFLPPLPPPYWIRCWCIARFVRTSRIVTKFQHLSVSILLLTPLSLYYACTWQKLIMKPKPWKMWKARVTSECPEMSEEFCCCVVHSLGFFLCFML